LSGEVESSSTDCRLHSADESAALRRCMASNGTWIWQGIEGIYTFWMTLCVMTFRDSTLGFSWGKMMGKKRNKLCT